MMTPSRVLVAKAGRARPRRVVCTPATSLTSLRYLRRLVAASAEQETAAETSEQAGHLESRAGRGLLPLRFIRQRAEPCWRRFPRCAERDRSKRWQAFRRRRSRDARAFGWAHRPSAGDARAG